MDAGALAEAFGAAACLACVWGLGGSTFAVDGRLEEMAAVDIRAFHHYCGAEPRIGVMSAVRLETGVLSAKLGCRSRVA